MAKTKCCCEEEVSQAETAEISAEAACDCRKRQRSDSELKALIHRLNRVEGQIRGIRAMVEEERYCVDILTQVSAAKSALDGFSQILLDQHVRTCVAKRIQDGDEDVIDELCMVLKKMSKG